MIQCRCHCGTTVKYYLDISRDEQAKRLNHRRNDPLHQAKMSPIDAKAEKYWEGYSEARNAMLKKTHGVYAPWIVVRADDKRSAQLNVNRDIISRCVFHGKKHKDLLPDLELVFSFVKAEIKTAMIAP